MLEMLRTKKGGLQHPELQPLNCQIAMFASLALYGSVSTLGDRNIDGEFIFDDTFLKKMLCNQSNQFSGPFSENCKHAQQVMNNGHASPARVATGDQAAKQTGLVLKLFTRSQKQYSKH